MKMLWTAALCFGAGILCFAVLGGPALNLTHLSLPHFGAGESKAGVRLDAAADSSDNAKLERFLRRYYAWPNDVAEVKIGAFRPASMPGFFVTTVEAVPKTGRGQGVKQDFFVSADGRYVLENEPLRVDGDPFRDVRDRIDIHDQPAFGSALPKVTIVEYGDFQCPYCKDVNAVVRQAVPREFGREVRVIFKDRPLYEIHPWAWDASSSGRCIYKQKPAAFWDYHDWAYDQQGRLSQDQFKKAAAAFAVTKQIDMAKYNACLADPATRADIQKELDEGNALKVSGTPAFFINGRKVEGSLSFTAMRQYILSELEYQGAR